MAKRILAVGHDAYRAGAQIVFLHILRWLREHHDAELSLLLAAGGAIEADYAAVLPTTVLPSDRDRRRGIAARLPRPLARRRTEAALAREVGRLERRSVDLVYVNSAAAAPLAVALAQRLRCPSVCHVHELEMSILRSPGARRMREATQVLDGYIAVSNAVRHNLVTNHGIDESRIDLVPECIPLPTPVSGSEGARLAAERGIPPTAFVIGGCGTLDWRKGPDVFLLVAKAVARQPLDRPVHFLWVGGEPRHLGPLEHDLDRLGLRGTVHFVGVQPDPRPYFERFDAFLLASREDPFPLVCLEAASVGVPTICFADAGGIPEFVEEDAGVVVGYLDIEEAARQLVLLARDDRRRTQLGARAAEKVAERCSVDVVGPQLAGILDRYLS